MNIINLLIINSNTNSKILSVHRQPTVYHMGGGHESHESYSIALWVDDHLVAANNIGILDRHRTWDGRTMDFESTVCYTQHYGTSFLLHSLEIHCCLTFKNLNDTLHTQSTNAKHLQCHIMVPPSFNQWDKIGTLQHSFLTIFKNGHVELFKYIVIPQEHLM